MIVVQAVNELSIDPDSIVNPLHTLSAYNDAFQKEKTEFYQWVLLETGLSYGALVNWIWQ